MKRRSKIIATLVTLSLSLAMIVIGVYSATLVSFGISGSIAYEIEDVFVNITTKVYSSDIIADNTSNVLKNEVVGQYSSMIPVKTFGSLELYNGVESLSNTSISDIDTSKYNLIKSYTYSSLTGEGDNPITDLTFEFNSTNAKTYFIVINVENLSTAPVYAVVQDNKTVPENTVELNNGLQQNILQGEKNRNIVFALGVADFTRPVVAGSKFECGIKVGLGDISQTPENLAKLNLAYNSDLGGYTASIKQDAKGVVVVPETSTDTSRATNQIVATMPIKMPSGTDVTAMFELMNPYLTCVVLPDTVTYIAPVSFAANVALTKIDGLDNVLGVGQMAFAGCLSLSKLDLPDSCGLIDAGAFVHCSNLAEFNIPSALTQLNDETFSHCTSLRSLDLKNVNQLVGGLIFRKCLNLEDINFGNIKSIPDYSFSDCSKLSTIEWGSVENIGRCAFMNCSELKSLNFSNNIKVISQHAFYHCTGLEFITIPNCVTEIGYRAFDDCSNVKQLNYNANVTTEYTTDQGPFKNTGSSEGFKVIIGEDNNSNYISIPNHLFSDNKDITDLELKNNVTSIGNYSFSGCDTLINISMSSGLISIGESAFSSCRSLCNVILPESVESIGNSAFSGCSSLVNIDLANVKSIGLRAFNYCNALRSITIPQSITSLDSIKEAFTWTNLVQVTNNSSLNLTANDLYINSNVGVEISKTGTFTNTLVKGEKYTTFIVGEKVYLMGFTNPSQETTANDIPNNVTDIYSHAFYSLKRLISVVMPDSVQSIGNDAFRLCSNLTSIDLGNVQNIGNDAFENCSGLTSVVMPDSVQSIGKDAFLFCSGLTSIDLGNVQNIGNDAFRDCSGLTSVVMSDSVQIIGERAFSGTAIETIKIPDSVTEIGSSAFSICSGLTSITIPKSVTYISNDAFIYCDGITSIVVDENNEKYTSQMSGVETNCIIEKGANNTYTLITGCKNSTLPYGITSIGSYAFYGCTGLTSIEIPDSVTSIGSYAFYNCTGLTSIEIPDSVKSIGDKAFSGCDTLERIDFKNVLTIGEYAFQGCNAITSIVIPDCVEDIDSSAFSWWRANQSIYLEGTPANLGSYWSGQATVYYYSESQPTTEGNYWHYVNGVATPWNN